MIPAAFDYVVADSADAAVAALSSNGDDAKLLAGGHSLLPLMKFRLATPAGRGDSGRRGERTPDGLCCTLRFHSHGNGENSNQDK